MPAQFLPLSAFVQDIKDTLDSSFDGYIYTVLAETTDVKIYWDRTYAFLKLIEKNGNSIVAEVGAVIWSQQFGIIKKFEKETGTSFQQNLELLLDVEVQFHPRYGLRLSIVNIDASYTLGKFELKKAQTLQLLLEKEATWIWKIEDRIITKNQELEWPLFVKKIALISAKDSDGRRDFIHELKHNEYTKSIAIEEIFVPVQGAGAGKKIAAELRNLRERISNDVLPFEILCIVRGGGSNTDFESFDEYEVAIEIAKFPVPIITGIGHERNLSLADLVANSIAKTPTKCANIISEWNENFVALLQQKKILLQNKVQQWLQARKNKIQQFELQIQKAAIWKLNQEKQKILFIKQRVDNLSLQRNLSRGFAILQQKDKVLSGIEEIDADHEVKIIMHDGIAMAKILNVNLILKKDE